MDADRWRLVNRILTEALELPAAERSRFLNGACRKDAELRAEVESLIAAAEQSGWLDNPARVAVTRTGAASDAAGGAARGGSGGHIALLAGQQFGPYRVLRKLGEGGMGVVYHAVDSRLGRPVALKLLSLAEITEHHRSRFAREARAASALNHPNIATIYEFDALQGVDFIAMEYVEGVTLADVLAERKTPQRQLLECARQVALAAGAAHAAGVVHRDLKPGNIMITPAGVAKVLDFGLAKLETHSPDDVEATRTVALTRTGAVIGTPAYMAPEQVAGEGVDYRTDIFAFGILLYEMVCGERPFRAPNPHSTLHLIATAEPKSVVEFNAAVPARLVSLIDRCLKKKKEERLQSMEEAAAELGKVLEGEERRPEPVKAGASRRVAIGMAVASVLAAGIGGYWFLRPEPAVPRVPTGVPAGVPAGVPLHSVTCSIEVQHWGNRQPVGDPYLASFRDTFESGMRFRFLVDSRVPGYVYVLDDAGGAESPVVLFPPAKALELMEARQRATTSWFHIEGPPQTERLWLVWSARPIPDFDPGDTPAHTDAIRSILAKLQSGNTVEPGGVAGTIELRGAGEVLGTQVEIHHR